MESDILHKSNFNNSSNNNNSGPRVKFNRDVHVKRYGSGNYEPNSTDLVTPSTHPPAQHQPKQPTLNFRRELPQDLSEEALRREAALVLEQANHFGSLPLRKNRGKPVRRSISDASTKKPKKNSILNLFATNSNINAKSSSLEPEPPKKIERSQSDASRTSSLKREKHKIQLSNNHTNSLTNSSDSENFLLTSTPNKKIQLSPITEVQGRGDYFDEVDRSGEQVETKKKSQHFGNIGFTSHEDLDLIPTTEKKANKSLNFKSTDQIHCSQMPPEKPQLTKGVAVDSMIKRLSLDRFSPPPQILTAGGFSYTNPHSPLSPKQQSLSPLTINAPNDNDVVYAQVVCNETSNGNKKHKSTIHNTIKKYRSNSPPNTKHNNYNLNNDTVDFGGKLKSFNDPDEGFGNELKSKFTEDFAYHDEPVIKPTIRLRGPERVGVTKTFISKDQDEHNGYNGFSDHLFQNGNNSKFFDMRDMEYNDLSYRREILESRIKSRIGGLRTDSTFVQKHNGHNHISPPPRTKDKKYHKYESKEIITRYSPDRNHHDVISPTTDLNYHLEQQPIKYTQHDYTDSSLRSKNHYYLKNADRGDSGIEHDYRKDSIDDHKLRSRFNIGRKWNYQDDIIESELFLMKERKHTQETNPPVIRTFVYRERSIDDGSHYDPNIDKLNIIRERRHNEKVVKDFIKSRKKKSGMEKVKELFKPKKPTMVEHNELSSRYREYSPKPEPEISAQQHIANRRRLSTPTSSPITNRSTSLPPKNMRGNKTVVANAKSSTLVKKDKENINSSQKFSWFSSLDRLANKKKSKESSFEKTSSQLSKSDKSSSMRALPTNSMTNGSTKTLRFFGDTDNDETISKGRSKRIFNQHSSQPILEEHKSSTLIRTKKPYQSSAYELNSTNDDDYYKTYRTKSMSLQNLNSNRKPKNKNVTRSRNELQNISESTSDTEVNGKIIPTRYSPVMNKSLPPPRPPKSKTVSTTLPRNHQSRKFDADDVDRSYLHRDVREASPFRTKKDFFENESNLTSARKMRDRSLSSSRERERNDSDASQRSVVYLHATTVGDIPQTMGSEGRSRISGRSSVKTAIQEQRPMSRSVARSVSMSAPWKPKFRSGEYEINYSPENNQMNQTKHSTSTTPRTKTASRERLSDRYSRSDKRLDLSHTKRI